MLTNTYECLAIILQSLQLVANCIRKPIRLIFATFWRICREYFCLHSQGYSPQCESSIYKMYKYGRRGIAFQWMESCLSNRRQFVLFKYVKSEYTNVSCGVPFHVENRGNYKIVAVKFQHYLQLVTTPAFRALRFGLSYPMSSLY